MAAMSVNQLLFFLKYLLNKLLVVCAQVLDIASVMLLKLGLRLYPSTQILHFYYLDRRAFPKNWSLLLLLWLLNHLRRCLNFLNIGSCNLSRSLWSLHLAHFWWSRSNFWLLTEEILLAATACSQVRCRSVVWITRRNFTFVGRYARSCLDSITINLTARNPAICCCWWYFRWLFEQSWPLKATSDTWLLLNYIWLTCPRWLSLICSRRL